MSWQDDYRARLRGAEEALSAVQNSHRVYIHMGAAAPKALIDALCSLAPSLRGVEVLHCITIGDAPYTDPRFHGHLRHLSLFAGANVRRAVQQGRADHIPIFLHEIERLFESGDLPIDAALIQCTPPDRNGWMSLGPSVDISITAARLARHLIVQVNERLPFTYGDSILHVSAAHSIVEADLPLPEFTQGTVTEVHRAIAHHVSSLIPDRATLQIGVGGIPEAVLESLSAHKDLGVHTEMFSDGLIPLIESGVVTNAHKTIHRHKAIASFAMGTERFYRYIHENPLFEFLPNRYVNDPFVIAQNDHMAAVNAALEVDLTGQVCSDSIGPSIYSGIGGQVDFIRGAARSRGGVPILALPATARNGTVSRIVPFLKPGAGVVTSRGDVHWVVTEHGAVNLFGKSIRQRAEALISIAAPQFRPELERAVPPLLSSATSSSS